MTTGPWLLSENGDGYSPEFEKNFNYFLHQMTSKIHQAMLKNFEPVVSWIATLISNVRPPRIAASKLRADRRVLRLGMAWLVCTA